MTDEVEVLIKDDFDELMKGNAFRSAKGKGISRGESMARSSKGGRRV